jgi:hypothetical protein
MIPDLNVLLAASRSDHPQHAPALGWLKQAIAECDAGGSIELLPMIAADFLRMATHPKIFVIPMRIDAAFAFIDSLLAIPGVDMPELGREWPALRQLCTEHELAANDLPNAWIAAAARTLGSRLITFDRGFTRLLGRTELTVLKPA